MTVPETLLQRSWRRAWSEVRAEYAWVDDAVFRGRRRDVLTGFLARPTIYATAHFRALLEAAARTNLERSIARLEDPP